MCDEGDCVRAYAVGQHSALRRSRFDKSAEAMPVPLMSQIKMFVCTFAGSILNPGICARPSARNFALA